MATQAPHHSDTLDAQLVLRAQDGDREAFVELFRRHAKPAWRLALAVSGSPEVASDAVAAGFTLSLVRLQRRTTTLAVPFRHLVTRASGEAAASASRRDDTPADPAPNEVAEAFLALPERWRAALWLTLVEGGTPAQVAPIIGLSEEGTASLVDRAQSGLRTRFARSTPLGAYLLRDRSDAAQKLRAIALPLPLALEADAVARWQAWQQALAKDKRHGLAAVLPLRPWAERAVSTAAAVVFAAGIAAAINLGAQSARRDAPAFASPAAQVGTESATGEPATVHTARGVSLPAARPVSHTSVARGAHGSTVTGGGATGGSTPGSGAGAAPGTGGSSDGGGAPSADAPSAPDAPADTQGDATPSADAGVNVAGTPVAVTAGTGGVGVTVGSTTVGNTTPTAPSGDGGVVIAPGGGVDPIGVTLP